MKGQAEREWWIRRGDLAAASAARRQFAAFLRAQESDKVKVQDAELIFGEIVSNAVRYARTSVEIELLRDSWATLRVTDDGECFDECTIAPRPLQAESGRGLYIAKALARAFGVSYHDGKCTISATLPVRGRVRRRRPWGT
jgi:anti-sigma regulatory factor (Ser/Thr protein kinase)